MKILNLDGRDYHMHSSNFSDGMSSVDEIVRFAGEIGLAEIAITDHSQVSIDLLNKKFNTYLGNTARYNVKRWENVFNDVNVIFGVEGDLLDEEGNACFDIQGEKGDFLILSAHNGVFRGNPEKVTEATIKAMEKHKDKIKLVAHPCNNSDFGKYYDIEKLVEASNFYKIPLEFNAKNLYRGKTNLEKLDYLLKNTNEVYLNSDAHTLWEIKETRKFAIEFLKSSNYI